MLNLLATYTKYVNILLGIIVFIILIIVFKNINLMVKPLTSSKGLFDSINNRLDMTQKKVDTIENYAKKDGKDILLGLSVIALIKGILHFRKNSTIKKYKTVRSAVELGNTLKRKY